MTALLRSRPRLLLGAVSSLLLAAALVTGCRGVLGIEEREFDDTLADGGADADAAPDPLSCDAYCDLIQAECTGDRLQYGSREACIGFCSSLAVGTLDDQSGNTLGCRINTIKTSVGMIEASDCAAGGPGGNGVCGANCDSLCASMMDICPQNYESLADCTDACSPLITCGPYHVDPAVTPDNPSVQCRLFHLSAASLGILTPPDDGLTSSQKKHCPHAMGELECIDVQPPGACPSP